MADVALLRESGGNVVRIVSALEILEVTTDARGVGQVVVSIGMTLGTLHVGMSSGERPAGSGVIENSRGPVRRTVTHFTLLRETSGDVIRIVGALVIL